MINSATVDLVTVIGNIAIALSFVIALVFGIAQVRAASRDRRERLTLETLRAFSDRGFAELMYMVQRQDLPKTGEALRVLERDQQVLFIQMAQMMEGLGVMVAEELISLDLVDKTLGDFVITAWKKYQPVFLDMRANIPDPFLGEYFQWLAEHIEKRMTENPREPFYRTGPA